MARIKLIEPDDMQADQRARYDTFPANLVRGLENAPQMSVAYGMMGGAIHHAALPSRLRELAILRVGFLMDSAYELMQHRHLALREGFDETQIEAARVNDLTPFTDEERDLLSFVHECVTRVKVSEKTFHALQRRLPDDQLVELVMLIGHYMSTARFLETFEIDLDDAPTSWEHV